MKTAMRMLTLLFAALLPILAHAAGKTELT